MMDLDKVKTITLPTIFDERGNLSVFENDQYFPFEIKQVAWLCANGGGMYDIDLAYETTGRVIIVFSGTMKLTLISQSDKQELILDSQCNCVYVPPLVECRIIHCSDNTIAFLASNEICAINDPANHFYLNKKIINEGYQLFE